MNAPIYSPTQQRRKIEAYVGHINYVTMCLDQCPKIFMI